MAHRVVGVDIGTYSVKAVVIEASFRSFEVVEFTEEVIRPEDAEEERTRREERRAAHAEAEEGSAENAGEDSERGETLDEGDAEDNLPNRPALPDGTRAALRRLTAQGVVEGDYVVAALPASRAFVTRQTLPFSTRREIEQVIGPQLDGQIPGDVMDFLVDFMIGYAPEGGSNTVFAAAVEPAYVAESVATLTELEIEPRVLDLAPFPLATAAALLLPPSDAPVAIVDIGGESTDIVVLSGDDPQFVRSIPFGGERLTERLASLFELPLARAREGKHREAFIDAAEDAAAPLDEDARAIADTCRDAMQPLVRQLRRTLQAHATEYEEPVGAIYLCGGGSSLRGLAEHIEQSVGVPTSRIPLEHPALAGIPDLSRFGHRFVSALGIALRGTNVDGGSAFNLRKGPFAFRGTYELIRSYLPAVAGLAAALILSTVAMFGTEIWAMSRERAALQTALEETSEQLFGQTLSGPERIIGRLEGRGGDGSFVPKTSAYDLFARLSALVGDLQVEGATIEAGEIEVDLGRKIFMISGRADSADTVDTLESRIEELECLREVQRDELARARGQEGFEFEVRGVASCVAAPEEGER